MSSDQETNTKKDSREQDSREPEDKAQNKDQDFWNSSRDDAFWSKSVIPEDWKQETPQDTNQDTLFETSQDTLSNPYYQEPSVGSTASPAPAKRVPVHRILCLAFLGIAIFSLVLVSVSFFVIKKAAQTRSRQLSFSMTEAENDFYYNENNRVILQDTAYTLVSGENFSGFPKGKKLAGVYVEVYSDDYVKDSYALTDLYVGYPTEDGEQYALPMYESNLSAYLVNYGLDRQLYLSTYGIGNGRNERGFYFFLIPEETETLTLYFEKRTDEGIVSVLREVYYKEMRLQYMDEEQLGLLINGKEAGSNE